MGSGSVDTCGEVLLACGRIGVKVVSNWRLRPGPPLRPRDLWVLYGWIREGSDCVNGPKRHSEIGPSSLAQRKEQSFKLTDVDRHFSSSDWHFPNSKKESQNSEFNVRSLTFFLRVLAFWSKIRKKSEIKVKFNLFFLGNPNLLLYKSEIIYFIYF